MWCISVCHPHLTIIICCTAVWAQACGLEHKTSFVIHRASSVQSASSIVFHFCWCVGGSSITILPLLVQFNRTRYSVTILSILCKTLRRKIHTHNSCCVDTLTHLPLLSLCVSSCILSSVVHQTPALVNDAPTIGSRTALRNSHVNIHLQNHACHFHTNLPTWWRSMVAP